MKEHRILYAGLTLTNGAKMAAHGRRCNFEIIANFIGGSTMKNTMRKMLSLALVVVMLACAIPFSAFAVTGEPTLVGYQLQDSAGNIIPGTTTDYVPAVEGQSMELKPIPTIAGWTAQSTTWLKDGAPFTSRDVVDRNMVLFVRYEKVVCHVSYYANGILCAEGDVYYGSPVTAVTAGTPTKAGSVFVRWERADGRPLSEGVTGNTVVNAVFASDPGSSNGGSDTTVVPATVKVTVLKNDAAHTQVGVYTDTVTDINSNGTYDIARLIPNGYTFISRQNGSTVTKVNLKAGENAYTVIVSDGSNSGNSGNSTAVPATVKVTVLKNDTARTQVGVYSVSIADINVTPKYDIKNLIPSGYTFVSRQNGSTVTNVTLKAGENAYTVIVDANSTSVSGGSNTSGGIWLGNNNNVVNKDPWPVYLNIYMNGNVSTIAKKVDITKGIAADGYVDLEDVKTVVKSYFNAKDSDGIQYDGLYIFDGSFGGQYTTDVGRVDGYGNINEDRKLSTVNINVMIKNAVAKGSVAADTSNPKTGDMAFLTVTALVASAGALALVYANKKRFLVK